MLEVIELTKEYQTPAGPLPVLEGVDFALRRGESAAIMGPSGSGKSTFLYIVGALEPPTSGRVLLDGSNPFELSEEDLAAYRNRSVGFVFQDHCLLPQCSVLENVLIPTLVDGTAPASSERARRLLDQVGLAARLEHLPSQLSGGERQRVSLARALIRKPSLLLCDEPTGNLDRESAGTVASLLLDLHREENTILIVVTHNDELASRFAQCFALSEKSFRRIE